MLTNVHFFNPLVKQGLEDICLNYFYPAVDLILENFHLVSEWNSLQLKAVNQTTVNGLTNIIDSIFRKRKGLHISQNRLSAPVLKTPSAFITGGIQ